MRMMFGLVRNLTVTTLLGTSFVDKCIRGVFPRNQRIFPFKISPLPTVVVLETTNVGATDQLTQTVGSVRLLQEKEPNSARVARTVTLQPFAKTPVLLVISARSLVQVVAFAVFIQNYP